MFHIYIHIYVRTRIRIYSLVLTLSLFSYVSLPASISVYHISIPDPHIPLSLSILPSISPLTHLNILIHILVHTLPSLHPSPKNILWQTLPHLLPHSQSKDWITADSTDILVPSPLLSRTPVIFSPQLSPYFLSC